MAIEPQVYRVYHENLPVLVDRLAKLNRRAAKIGCAPITWEEVGVEEYRRKDRDGWDYLVRIHVLRLTGESPIINGWQFAAALDFISGDADHPEEVILRTVPNLPFAVPEAYRHTDRHCDHCQLVRRRNTVYVITNGSEWKQVGSNCLADFLGHADPHLLAAAAEILMDAADILSDGLDERDMGGRGERCIDVLDYLTHVAASIRQDGWMSRSKARELGYDVVSTVERVDFWLAAEGANDVKELLHCPQITPADQEKAVAAIDWVRDEMSAREDLSEYEHNLTVALRRDHAPESVRGLVGSAVAVYERHLNELAAQRVRDSFRNEYAGAEGVKFSGRLYLLSLHASEGQFGPVVLHRFVDEANRVLIWWTGRENGSAGQWYQARGTIKRLSEYRGLCQTELARVKLSEVPA